jgi:hypothetical protein
MNYFKLALSIILAIVILSLLVLLLMTTWGKFIILIVNCFVLIMILSAFIYLSISD